MILKPTPGLSASPCVLAKRGSTCNLTLTINGSSVPAKGIFQGPILCDLNNPNQCYQPSAVNQLKINKNAVTLTLSPETISFSSGTTSSPITLKNSSLNTTAVELNFAPSANLTLVNNTCDTVLAAQQSCTFALNSSVVSTGNTVTIKGKNTNTVVLPVSVTGQSLNITAVGIYFNPSPFTGAS